MWAILLRRPITAFIQSKKSIGRCFGGEMSSGNGRQKTRPFPPEYRASGLLLHVTSLPSPYGIGDLGPEAFAWIDRLHDAGQRWWQALPLGPTGYGNSPYQPLSSFAGNALAISPQSGLLLHVTSLPSPYGIGDLEQQAR